MDILLIGPRPRIFSRDYFLPWVDYTARALRRLKNRVAVFPYRELWANSPSLRHRLERSPRLLSGLARWRQTLRRERDQRLLRMARQLRPDLTLILKGEEMSMDLLTGLKRFTAGPLVSWWVDDPFQYPLWLENLALLDHLFIFDRSYIEPLISHGAGRVHFLPCACDETVYRPLRLTPAQRKRFGCDISFIAWYDPRRAELVKALSQEMQVGVWGGGWDSPQAQSNLPNGRWIRGSLVPDRVASRIYNASRIGLNVHHAQTRWAGLNSRTFELLACGLFELTDRVQGMEELLTPDEEIVCYSSEEEARRLAKIYLADPSARARIALRGRERVLADHTYLQRMRRLCGWARG